MAKMADIISTILQLREFLKILSPYIVGKTSENLLN